MRRENFRSNRIFRQKTFLPIYEKKQIVGYPLSGLKRKRDFKPDENKVFDFMKEYESSISSYTGMSVLFLALLCGCQVQKRKVEPIEPIVGDKKEEHRKFKLGLVDKIFSDLDKVLKGERFGSGGGVEKVEKGEEVEERKPVSKYEQFLDFVFYERNVNLSFCCYKLKELGIGGDRANSFLKAYIFYNQNKEFISGKNKGEIISLILKNDMRIIDSCFRKFRDYKNGSISEFAAKESFRVIGACDLYRMLIYDNKKKREDVALLIVDMQDRFLKKIDKNELEKEIPNYIKLIEEAKARDMAIFALEYYACGKTISKLRDVMGKDYVTVVKKYDNGFYKTKLDKLLRAEGVEKIILTGVNASACVKRTAKGGLKRDYKIITSKDVIAEPKKWDQNESEKWYKENCNLFEDCSGIVNYLDGNNQFK